jgi:acetylornithine deacetylase/succinyl-diaminopimelate desuccinylase-like protein
MHAVDRQSEGQVRRRAPRHLPALYRARTAAFAAWLSLLGVGAGCPLAAHAAPLKPHQRLAVEIYKELVEINTVSATGDTGQAADGMAARLRAAGFDNADVQVFKPAPRKGNLVARLRGTGARKPILLLAHLDVVPANPEDWSFDPFRFIEKDGYFYGRGTSDDKAMAATLVANLIRFKAENYKPARDIVVALTADEEIGGRWGIQWLVENERQLIDAEFALNEGGGVVLKKGKPFRVNVQTTEKASMNFRLEATSKGGHSSLPAADNAIYRVAEGLARLSKFSFPVNLNPTSRAALESIAEIEDPRTAADIRSILSADPAPAALARLSTNAAYNAQIRTTCVATMVEGGHAVNTLPQVARATINCRVMPGESTEDVRTALVRVLADDRIAVTHVPERAAAAPSEHNEELWHAIESTAAEFWPGAPVVAVMAAGATDGRVLRHAGIPTYGHTGLASGEMRAHGKDERVAVKSFFESTEYLYRLVRRLSE